MELKIPFEWGEAFDMEGTFRTPRVVIKAFRRPPLATFTDHDGKYLPTMWLTRKEADFIYSPRYNRGRVDEIRGRAIPRAERYPLLSKFRRQ